MPDDNHVSEESHRAVWLVEGWLSLPVHTTADVTASPKLCSRVVYVRLILLYTYVFIYNIILYVWGEWVLTWFFEISRFLCMTLIENYYDSIL